MKKNVCLRQFISSWRWSGAKRKEEDVVAPLVSSPICNKRIDNFARFINAFPSRASSVGCCLHVLSPDAADGVWESTVKIAENGGTVLLSALGLLFHAFNFVVASSMLLKSGEKELLFANSASCKETLKVWSLLIITYYYNRILLQYQAYFYKVSRIEFKRV